MAKIKSQKNHPSSARVIELFYRPIYYVCLNNNRGIMNTLSDFKNEMGLILKITIIFSCVLISKFRHETNISLSHDVTTFSHMKFHVFNKFH